MFVSLSERLFVHTWELQILSDSGRQQGSKLISGWSKPV
jgi:hypothetical protein